MKEVQPEGTGSQAGGPSGVEGGHILGPFGGQKGSAAGAAGLGGEGVQQSRRRRITWSFRPQKAFGFCLIPQVRWKVTGSFPLTVLGQGAQEAGLGHARCESLSELWEGKATGQQAGLHWRQKSGVVITKGT